MSTAATHLVPDTPLAFALATAGRLDRLRIYHGGNRTVDARWGGLRLPERPYAVYTHDRALRTHDVALDFDGKRGDPEKDAAQASSLLGRAGIWHVLCSSGGGGFHVLTTFSPGLPKETVADLAAGFGALAPSLDPSPLADHWTAAIRPPLSPHRSGGQSRVRQPATEAEALRVLRFPNPNASAGRVLALLPRVAPKVPTTPTPASPDLTARYERPASARTMELLRSGDMDHRYRTGSEAEFAVVLGLIDAGWSEARIREAFADPGNLGCPSYQRRLREGAGRADQYLSRQIRKADDFARAYPPAKLTVDPGLAAVVAAAEAWHPGGRTGAADRAVLLAHVRAAVQAGSRTYGLAWRTAAEWSGAVKRERIRASESRLRAAGWVAPDGGTTEEGARRWVVTSPEWGGEKRAQSLMPPNGGEGGGAGARWGPGPGHPLWHPRALGPGVRETLGTLDDGGRPLAAIARATGHDRKTVRAHLRRLADLGLAAQTPAGWVATGRSLDDALGELPPDAQTAAQRQRERHQRERAAWRARKGTG